jgi:hypothetical protein
MKWHIFFLLEKLWLNHFFFLGKLTKEVGQVAHQNHPKNHIHSRKSFEKECGSWGEIFLIQNLLLD